MFTRFRLMNAAGGLGDGGGTGGDNGDNGGANGGNTNNNNNEYVGPEWAKDWEGVAELEADLLGDPSLKVFNNPTALLKSYVHAQKQLGKKGVMIPSENSPKEEWDQFYAKVGVPLEEDKYKESLKFPEKNELGEEFNSGFLKLAHESRVKPEQAAKLYEYFNAQVKAGADKQMNEYAEKTQEALNNLQKEWGPEAYSVKLTKAEAFLKEHAGEEFIKYLGQSGLGKNAELVKAFATMAEKLTKEGDIPSGDSTYGMTINDLEREINNVMGNLQDPYYNPSHPDHKRKVEEVLNMRRKLDKAQSRN